jgi:hypothetical protein
MLRLLIAKDLLRARRNPLPWLINLIVPLAMTGLLGLVFGSRSDGGALGRIHFAVVDEDKSVMGELLREASNEPEGSKYLDPVFMDREDAMRKLNESKLSAVLIIPTNFTRNYLTGREAISVELVKNPAESVHPAVLEELLGAAVTGLNVISRNFHSEFPAWPEVVEGKYRNLSAWIEWAGDRLNGAERFIDPPLVGYETSDREEPKSSGSVKEVVPAKTDTNRPSEAWTTGPAEKGAKAKPKSGQQKNGVTGAFAYLLIGLSAMFLLFLANNAMTDLHRELRKRTFERYQTIHQAIWPFVAGKVVFAVVILLLCTAILVGGGGLIFGIHWDHPLELAALAFGYACFMAALFAVLVGLMPDERRAGVLNNITGMALGLVGGCAFPARQLPGFLREHVTPLMPSNWFVETARNLEFGNTGVAWGLVTVKLLVLGLVLTAVAGMLFRRMFREGSRV